MTNQAIKIEQHMEACDIPESDRDEIRTMIEFLEVRKSKSQIKPKLKDWLTGNDVSEVTHGQN